MDGGPGPRFCTGPAGLAFAMVALVLALLGAAFVAPGAAVLLFMAVPALIALTVLWKARERMRRSKRPPE